MTQPGVGKFTGEIKTNDAKPSNDSPRSHTRTQKTRGPHDRHPNCFRSRRTNHLCLGSRPWRERRGVAVFFFRRLAAITCVVALSWLGITQYIVCDIIGITTTPPPVKPGTCRAQTSAKTSNVSVRNPAVNRLTEPGESSLRLNTKPIASPVAQETDSD